MHYIVENLHFLSYQCLDINRNYIPFQKFTFKNPYEFIGNLAKDKPGSRPVLINWWRIENKDVPYIITYVVPTLPIPSMKDINQVKLSKAIANRFENDFDETRKMLVACDEVLAKTNGLDFEEAIRIAKYVIDDMLL